MNDCPDKLEPMNHTARESLMKAIHSRRLVIQTCITWDAKTALDESEFAMISSVSEPLDKVIEYLTKSKALLVSASQSLAYDADRMEDLINLAREIKKSEEA